MSNFDSLSHGEDGVIDNGGSCATIIHNEMLCFVQQKSGILTLEDLVKMCLDFYKKDEVLMARQVIDNVVSKRLSRRQGPDMLKSTIEDIIKCVPDPTNSLPTFYAVNLNRLPPVDAKHCDITAILIELKELRADVREICVLKVEMESMRSQVKECAKMRDQVASLKKQLDCLSGGEFSHLSAGTNVSIPLTSNSSDLRVTYAEQAKALSKAPEAWKAKPAMRPPVIGASNRVSNMKSVVTKRTIDIFLSRLHPASDECDIRECLREIVPHVPDEDIQCKRLKSRYEQLYCSYYVAISVDTLEMSRFIELLLKADSWPSGVLVRRYFKPKVTTVITKINLSVLAYGGVSSVENDVETGIWHDVPQISMSGWMTWSEYSINSNQLDRFGGPRSRCKHAACLSGSHVYVFGGKSGNVALKDLWSFNIDSGVWRNIKWTGDKLPSLQEHSMVSYENYLYVYGGSFSDGFDADIPLWKFDIDALTCTKLAASNISCQKAKGSSNAGIVHPIGRRGHTAVVHGSSMFVYGGYVDMKGSSSELWKFNFMKSTWNLLSTSSPTSSRQPIARHSHSAVVYRQRIWVYGGLFNLHALDDLWTWHIELKRWSQVACRTRPPALEGHSASVIGHSMYILGGCENGMPQQAIWIFDFDFLTWTCATAGGIPCGPLIKHCCVVIACLSSEPRARRNHSLSSMRSMGSNRSSARSAPGIVRAEPRRATFPLKKTEVSQVLAITSTGSDAVCVSPQNAGEAGQLTVSNRITEPVTAENCWQDCAMTLKRNHKISVDEIACGGDTWNSSQQQLMTSSQMSVNGAGEHSTGSSDDFRGRRGAKNISSLSGVDNEVFHLADENLSVDNRVSNLADGSQAGVSMVDNRVSNLADGSQAGVSIVDDESWLFAHRLAAVKLGSAKEKYQEPASYGNFDDMPLSVELTSYWSNAEQLVVQNLGSVSKSSSVVIESLDSQCVDSSTERYDSPIQPWRDLVREAWANSTDNAGEEEESSLQSLEVENLPISLGTMPAKNSYSIYVFGGQVIKYSLNVHANPLSLYRILINYDN